MWVPPVLSWIIVVHHMRAKNIFYTTAKSSALFTLLMLLHIHIGLSTSSSQHYGITDQDKLKRVHLKVWLYKESSRSKPPSQALRFSDCSPWSRQGSWQTPDRNPWTSWGPDPGTQRRAICVSRCGRHRVACKKTSRASQHSNIANHLIVATNVKTSLLAINRRFY